MHPDRRMRVLSSRISPSFPGGEQVDQHERQRHDGQPDQRVHDRVDKPLTETASLATMAAATMIASPARLN